jgi:hypothetical protein
MRPSKPGASFVLVSIPVIVDRLSVDFGDSASVSIADGERPYHSHI